MSSTMAHRPARSFGPKLPALAAAGMVVAALVAVSAAKLAGYSPVQSLGTSEVAQSRLLRFESDARGVAVIDATTGATITHTSAEGFIPGVLRGLNRMRQTEDASIAADYRLEHRSNGQLVLVDTASGVALDLAAYGRDNAAAFLAFLSPSGDQS